MGFTNGWNDFRGSLDEVRLSSIARLPAWIQTEHNNQSSPSTFILGVGGEEQTATGAWEAVIGGDQSGRVYSVDTNLGVKNWEVLLTGADFIQAAAAAQVRAWSDAATFQADYSTDVIFVATRNAGDTNCGAGTSATNNKLFALRGDTGAVLWTFNDTCTQSVDWIVGMPYVDYARNRIYIASKAGGGSQQSLWVIDTRLAPATRLVTCPACTDLPPTGLKGVPLETSPTLSQDGATLYVGNKDVATAMGKLYAIDANNLTLKWTFDLGTGVFINGFVWEEAGKLYFSTSDLNAASNGYVWCLDASGAGQPAAPPASPAGSCPWKSNEAGAYSPVPSPSTPLLLGAPNPGLYVGSYNSGTQSEGKLFQINRATGLKEKQVTVGNGQKQVGDVSTETWSEIFVGTSEGKIFKFPLPLP